MPPKTHEKHVKQEYFEKELENGLRQENGVRTCHL